MELATRVLSVVKKKLQEYQRGVGRLWGVHYKRINAIIDVTIECTMHEKFLAMESLKTEVNLDVLSTIVVVLEPVYSEPRVLTDFPVQEDDWEAFLTSRNDWAERRRKKRWVAVGRHSIGQEEENFWAVNLSPVEQIQDTVVTIEVKVPLDESLAVLSSILVTEDSVSYCSRERAERS